MGLLLLTTSSTFSPVWASSGNAAGSNSRRNSHTGSMLQYLPNPNEPRPPKATPLMDFDQLHTFLEIVRLKSFSKAAQTCYRTQPAISAQVRQLEQELRTELFERFGSRISLTTAGRLFAQYAEQLTELRRQAQDAIAELEHNPRGELVIAANEATCIYVLPDVFSQFRER